MSKSLGNVLNLPDIVEKGFSPLDLRYYFLSVHYRTNLKFTEKGLEDAHKARRKVVEWMNEVKESKETEESKEWEQKFSEAMNADLNTPGALAVVFDLMSWSRNEGQLGACKEVAKMIKDTFGCFDEEAEEIPEDVLDLQKQRDEARENKDFDASDRLRDELADKGYEVRDLPDGQSKLQKI